jgi:hypothetical protein
MNSGIDKICIWYGIANSSSPEGLQFQSQHPEISFRNCIKNCNGYNHQCENYSERGKLETVSDGESEIR